MDSARALFRDPRLPERFWQKVVVADSGCWIWTGAKITAGYGNTTIGRKFFYTHRATLKFLKGDDRQGLVCDHLCRVRACCNPEHLEFVTNQENTLRGDSAAFNRARGATVTHCPAGHSYDAENTYNSKKGSRSCRECAR
jgi:hypothetical protein